jgi:hypothetical protein
MKNPHSFVFFRDVGFSELIKIYLICYLLPPRELLDEELLPLLPELLLPLLLERLTPELDDELLLGVL